MKQLKNFGIFMLVALMATSYVGCSKEDDSDIDLKSYIIGFWSTYKITVYANGESKDVAVSKTGVFSEAYTEFTFQDTTNCKGGEFQQDENGFIRWEEDQLTYSINGDVVTLRDSQGGTLDFVFDAKSKTLCAQGSITSNGIPMMVKIYWKK